MLYKIIYTILMSDVVGLLLFMQLWLSKYEENELEESQERLENTIESMERLKNTLDSFTPSQYIEQKIVNELTKRYEGE